MTGLGFGIGLGLVLSMLIWIGFEELRKKGPLSKEASYAEKSVTV